MEYAVVALELVLARLKAMSPNVKLSVGSHGTFTREQLISEVKKKSDLGRAMVEMQLNYIREMPNLSSELV